MKYCKYGKKLERISPIVDDLYCHVCSAKAIEEGDVHYTGCRKCELTVCSKCPVKWPVYVKGKGSTRYIRAVQWAEWEFIHSVNYWRSTRPVGAKLDWKLFQEQHPDFQKFKTSYLASFYNKRCKNFPLGECKPPPPPPPPPPPKPQKKKKPKKVKTEPKTSNKKRKRSDAAAVKKKEAPKRSRRKPNFGLQRVPRSQQILGCRSSILRISKKTNDDVRDKCSRELGVYGCFIRKLLPHVAECKQRAALPFARHKITPSPSSSSSSNSAVKMEQSSSSSSSDASSPRVYNLHQLLKNKVIPNQNRNARVERSGDSEGKDGEEEDEDDEEDAMDTSEEIENGVNRSSNSSSSKQESPCSPLRPSINRGRKTITKSNAQNVDTDGVSSDEELTESSTSDVDDENVGECENGIEV